ncbi:Alpha amylase, catalytic domain containing protein [Histomonas meleagridis]|uniref:Alpha amylase, catalytic domain containing protein n=1 Tax=Histomonas meleagridis TaxID=135588 RepID=UPI00355A964E|nr:Alpha amylase, catalytic domain containing protein [Histomonas meleagridis]KAH0798998.1 Alpha amylase, catalytic domain containing protein [Histomonas meleagridis]
MEEFQNEPLLPRNQEDKKKGRRMHWIAALCVGIGLVVGMVIGFVSFRSNKTSTTTTTTNTVGTSSNSVSNGLNTDFNSITIYQVMVSSFQGDGSTCYCTGYGPSSHKGNLKGIINALDYIKGLNVNALWLTPVFDSTGGSGGEKLQSTGYFATDYFNVDPKFGTNDDLRNLIKGCHDRGMYIFLDGVFGHHGGNVKASPNGNYPQGSSNPVSYPGSLEFYKEVALYWIREYEIDGWRLDQCYQLFQNNHNYWYEIRTAVQDLCNERKNQGKQWGTLGYMVGEHWSGTSEIQSQTYSQDGLKSAFDFPARYNLVQVIAQEESGAGGYGVSTLTNVFKTPSEKGYSSDVYPNLFITNHDVWRFGNLIRSKYGYDRSNEAYWKRYKIALGCLAAYTGPITIYYGDEVGDIADCWQSYGCGDGTASDNVARTDGHISGFNTNEQDLHDYTAKLMNIRLSYPAMYRGSNSVSTKDGALINVKWDDQTQTKIVFVVNTGTLPTTVYVNCGGSSFKELITGKEYSGNGGFNLDCDALTCYIFEAK